MKFRIIKTIDQDDISYDGIWFVKEEKNMEEKLDRLKKYEDDYNNLDRLDFEKKYNNVGIYDLISDYIENNFEIITDYKETDLYI